MTLSIEDLETLHLASDRCSSVKRGRLRLPAHRAATIEEQRHAYRLAAQLLAGRIEAGDVDAERLAAALLCGPLGPDFATATAA